MGLGKDMKSWLAGKDDAAAFNESGAHFHALRNCILFPILKGNRNSKM